MVCVVGALCPSWLVLVALLFVPQAEAVASKPSASAAVRVLVRIRPLEVAEPQRIMGTTLRGPNPQSRYRLQKWAHNP